jgi:galactokinase
VPAERVGAFAPGRVNLIGEHTDYNRGLALPFTIAQGVVVRAELRPPAPDAGASIDAHARDLDEHDEFPLASPGRADGWRAFVRGVVAELARAGQPLRGAHVEISGDLPRGAGLSSSAALEVALCLALTALGRDGRPSGNAPERPPDGPSGGELQRMELAKLCSRVENEWVGAHTGLLDQIACLYGAADTALCIDFDTLAVEPVPLRLDGWRLAVLDSGEQHAHASSGYNERRAECAQACQALGVRSLRHATPEGVAALPEQLRMRAEHVLGENERVRAAAGALRAGDLRALGALLDASHQSLRDRYQVSTPAVEAAVQRLRRAGAAGARMVGGGFGGSVLGLFAPDARPPRGAYEVRPGPGAHLLPG